MHASLEEDALAWKIANYVFYFSENHLLLLKKGPCVRGFELYHGYFRVGFIITVQKLLNMHLLNGKLNFIKLAKKGNLMLLNL